MPFSTYTDANKHLDESKLTLVNAIEATPYITEADRIISGMLFPTYGSHVTDWDIDGSPETPPVLVTEISGMLTASYFYAKKYSEESLDPNSYSSMLEARAMKLLEEIRDGTITFSDKTYVSGTALASSNFWPNDTYVNADGTPNRKFTMDDVY